MEDKLVSIVIPCYNEEKNIDRTLDQLIELADKHPYPFEIIVVNDGSLDGSWRVIKSYAQKYPQVIGVDISPRGSILSQFQRILKSLSRM
jgi:glycosyltransferase involved in cell wall biosynthesis